MRGNYSCTEYNQNHPR